MVVCICVCVCVCVWMFDLIIGTPGKWKYVQRNVLISFQATLIKLIDDGRTYYCLLRVWVCVWESRALPVSCEEKITFNKIYILLITKS